MEGGGIWTFASAEAVSAHLPQHYFVDDTTIKDLSTAESTEASARQAAFRLLTVAWHAFLRQRGLVSYQLANNKQCFFFPKGLIDTNEISFDAPDGRKGYRAIVGYKTRIDAEGKSWLRYWHYAIQPLPAFRPAMLVMVRSHVLFSSDGKTIWDRARRLQKARKDQCKGWWNDAWRDRVLAAMSWLAAGESSIALDVGASEPLLIDRHPILFESPVSYLESSNDTASHVADSSQGDQLNEDRDHDDDEDDDNEFDDEQEQEDDEP